MTKRHPYIGLPDRQFWKNEPGIKDYSAFDPVSAPGFTLSRSEKVVTAGSCFAQHLARHLSEAGYNHFITETAHPIFDDATAARFNYGMFSARYGNVYTARQLRQLVQRAYGEFTPLADHWQAAEPGRVVDPFRPQIHPEGYASVDELLADRAQHLSATRRALEAADVFVFTLGLTEAWEDCRDGAVFPLAPGVAGGHFDPALTQFRNLDVEETTADLIAALSMIRAHNPAVRLILTVSPVPLNATMEDRHVMQSTAWSKAVLRLAADRAAAAFTDCCYFPSYEVITSPHTAGHYFGPDCREVRAEGVAHVMCLFFKHFASDFVASTTAQSVPTGSDEFTRQMESANAVMCDEEMIDNM